MSSHYKKITLLFGGGCELLVGKQSSIVAENTVECGMTLQTLVLFVRDTYIQERPELFMDASSTGIRPGILVLVNGCDAEVVGGMAYTLEEGDEVEFISTLHGG